MVYRVNGRATQADERFLKNIDSKDSRAKAKSGRYFINDKEVTPKAKYKELKTFFDEYGWCSFDEEQTELFDILNAVYGAPAIDSVTLLDVPGDGDRTETVYKIRYYIAMLGAKLADDGEEPSRFRTILDHWRLEFPENDFPDYRADGSGIIKTEWTQPRKKSTKHATIADELQIVLDYYHALRASNEPMQSNFYVGDNDNSPKEDDTGNVLPPLSAAGEWEMGPSVKAIMKAVVAAIAAGLKLDKRIELSAGYHAGEALFGPNYRLIPYNVPAVDRDWQSRTVTERSCKSETSTPPVLKIGGLCFATSDFDPNVSDSKRRGELLEAGGYRTRDRARAAKESTAGKAEEDARRRAELSSITETSGCRMLPKEKKQKQWADRVKNTKPDPAFFTASKSLHEARAEHLLKPANDNQVHSGLPWVLPAPDYLVTKASPSLVATPEDLLLENESRAALGAAKSELSSDENQVIESFLSAESLAHVGRETGDEGRHERTQERNGRARILAVAAKLSARMAA
jgi:hypothetical protein